MLFAIGMEVAAMLTMTSYGTGHDLQRHLNDEINNHVQHYALSQTSRLFLDFVQIKAS